MPFLSNNNEINASIQLIGIGTLENKSKGRNIENLKAMYTTNADPFLNKKDDLLQFIGGRAHCYVGVFIVVRQRIRIRH